MKLLFACGRGPSEQQFPAFCASVRDAIHGCGLTMPSSIYRVPGPGCANIAFELVGDEQIIEQFAMGFALITMGKWCETSDKLPEKDTFIS